VTILLTSSSRAVKDGGVVARPEDAEKDEEAVSRLDDEDWLGNLS
jgi:hypothetical protein